MTWGLREVPVFFMPQLVSEEAEEMCAHLPPLNAVFFTQHLTSDHGILSRPLFLISGYVGNYLVKSRKIKVLKKANVLSLLPRN